MQVRIGVKCSGKSILKSGLIAIAAIALFACNASEKDRTAPPTPPDVPNAFHQWTDFKDSRNVDYPEKWILKAEYYRRKYPNDPRLKELDAMIDDSLDQLWRARIADLCAEAGKWAKDVKDKSKEIREETSVAFKKVLIDEMKVFMIELDKRQTHLKEMGYTPVDVPQIDDQASIQKLRTARDPDKFAAWKVVTLRYIKNHHGNLPWKG